MKTPGKRAGYGLGCSLLGLLVACGQAPSSEVPEKRSTPPVETTDATTAAPLPAFDSDVVKAAVKGMMDHAYGEAAFDAAKACWKTSFETPNDTLDYCMKAETPKVVRAGNGVQVYLLAYSDTSADLYSQVDPGLMGLMAASLEGNRWTTLASTPKIDMGQTGDCGCRQAELVDVGPERHGWLSEEGGVWQGVPVKQYSLVVPIEGQFQQVASIPQTTESAQGQANAVELDQRGGVVSGMYPLHVKQMRDGKLVKTQSIAFDPQAGRYPWKP